MDLILVCLSVDPHWAVVLISQEQVCRILRINSLSKVSKELL
ncbi:hypothetical protein M595_3130 [Lyngbya aestuarii BL J]|uniref:Uncharacterized protein n=1 Tax=Lyngbya aestuarii BL J TaxID=1348334 RepID=U7QIM6_9CYAN|nr:hypothetical protein M595_3130 [Lyngbya aestuarii BL J]